MDSQGRVSLKAAGAANCYAVYDQSTVCDGSNKTSNFLVIRDSSSSSSSRCIEDTMLQGTQVNAAWGSSLNAGLGEKARSDARLILEGVRTMAQQSRTAKSDIAVWQSQSGSGSAELGVR